jgi:hypothetical protein
VPLLELELFGLALWLTDTSLVTSGVQAARPHVKNTNPARAKHSFCILDKLLLIQIILETHSRKPGERAPVTQLFNYVAELLLVMDMLLLFELVLKLLKLLVLLLALLGLAV